MFLWPLLACSDRVPADHAASTVATVEADVGPDTGTGDTGLPADTAEVQAFPGLSATPAWITPGGTYATGAAWADLDGDGDGDLIISSGNDMSPGVVEVYENQSGALSETAVWRSTLPQYYGHLSAGDLNGDGHPDLVASLLLGASGFTEVGGLQIFLNDGSGLQDPPAWETRGFDSFANALGDVDRDGDLDLAVAVGEPYRHDPDLSRVYLNDGSADFGEGPAWLTETPRHSLDVAWLDQDGDGWLDLAFANEDTGHTLYHNALGTLETEPTWTAPEEGFEGNTLDWGDLDADGVLDLVVSDTNQRGGAGAVRAWCGAGLTLCWQAEDTPDYPSAVSLEDVDGDGDLDLAAGAWWGPVRLYENQGGALQTTASWSSTPSEPVVESLAWEDLDGSDTTLIEVQGTDLVALPGRCRVVQAAAGVAGDGYLTGPGPVSATCARSSRRDLVVTDWDPDGGTRVYGREE